MGSLSNTITECTMLACLALTFLVLFSAASALEDESEIISEINVANQEAKNLAEDLTDLIARFEIEGEEAFQNEEMYKDIVDKIQELAEATEEDNLIKLTETVKDRRIKEEEFQNSVENLQQLADKLEKASLSKNSKLEKESEMFGILETATSNKN